MQRDEIKTVFSDVNIKLKKGNKVLFSRDSKCLQDLIKLIQSQNHRTLVMWALDCAKATLKQFEAKYPDEHRPRTCLELCEDWAKGKIKMPIAKRAIIDSHAVAKEINDSEYGALCHAIGHAGATVHVETHALGLPFYELTAIVLKYGKGNFQKPVGDKINYYLSRLLYWQENTDKLELDWADFLLNDAGPNKEKLLNGRRKLKRGIKEKFFQS
ncbi:MAG: putative immunity protein [Bacillota bacterium]